MIKKSAANGSALFDQYYGKLNGENKNSFGKPKLSFVC